MALHAVVTSYEIKQLRTKESFIISGALAERDDCLLSGANVVPRGLATEYSFLVAAVIASAVAPTIIAGLFFVPAHLFSKTDEPVARRLNGLSDEG